MVSSSMTFFHTTVTLNHFKVIYIFILPWKNVDKAFTGRNGYSATSMESVTASRALPQSLFTASHQTALINGGEVTSEQALSLARLADLREVTRLPKTANATCGLGVWLFFLTTSVFLPRAYVPSIPFFKDEFDLQAGDCHQAAGWSVTAEKYPR